MTNLECKILLQKELAALLQAKTDELNRILSDLNNAASTESKSSAGDKYETGIEMLKQEQNKVGKQLQEALKMQAALQRIKPLLSPVAGLGSYIQTPGMCFFISVPFGKIAFNQQEIFCLSPQAPLAQALSGKKAGESILFNGKSFLLEKVL